CYCLNQPCLHCSICLISPSCQTTEHSPFGIHPIGGLLRSVAEYKALHHTAVLPVRGTSRIQELHSGDSARNQVRSLYCCRFHKTLACVPALIQGESDMVRFNIDPVLIHLGPLAISWYGIAVGLGILVGYWLTTREAARKGLPVEPVMDLMFWIVGGGLIGAR